jgi:hypothetical protein
MATTAELTQLLEDDLSGIQKDTAFLPNLAAMWRELPGDVQTSWELEWSELMAHLERLDAAQRAGALTVDQQARYRKLLRQLRAALPVIDELDFERPTVPLDV